MYYKYKIEEPSLQLPPKTKLNFQEKINRVPIELQTFLDDREAKIDMDKKNMLLVVESSILPGDKIHSSVKKCLTGLDLECHVIIESTF